MRRLLVCVAVALFATTGFAQSGLIFSEYIEGSSNNKALEIYNGTGAEVNLTGYSVQQFSNGNSTPSATINLSGTLPAGDVFVLAHSLSAPAIKAQADQLTGAGLFNGDDAVVLRQGTTFLDVIGQIGLDPGTQWGTGLASTADNTLRRKPGFVGDANGSDAFDPSIEWDGFATNTFDGLGFHDGGGVVPPLPPPPPPVTVLEIFEIQGSGNGTTYANQMVQTNDNVVTAVGPNGFFIQTPDYRGDASTATSNGIYVFLGATPTVSAGNQVDVKGRVVEFFDFTEFSGSVEVTVDAASAPLPAVFALPVGYSNFESVEGMLVNVDGTAAAGTDRHGDTMVVAGSMRPFRAPGVNGGDFPYIFDVKPSALGGAEPVVVGGATITATGPMAFEFGDYSLWATSFTFTNPIYPRNPRARNAGEMTVAAQNVLRLFDDVNDPAIGEPVTNPAVYAARLAALSTYVRTNLGAPDVLALSEVENLSTLNDLAARINADEAGLNYTAYLEEGNDIGGIDVGFLIRDTVAFDSVTQLGADDTWIDISTGQPDPLNDRPPLLLRGSYVGNGAAFPIAVIAVHQRSLIGVETNPRVSAKREAQAANLAAHINALQSAEPGLRIVVTGDFNAFEFNDGYVDVMGIITSSASLTNQVLSVSANDRYSYNHEGAAQVLDHSLTSSSLNPFVRALQFAHVNADAPYVSNAVSDHDGVVLFVMTDHDGDDLPDDVDACPTGDVRPTVVIDGCDSGAPNLAFAGGCTLADELRKIRENARNHGQAVAESGKLLNQLMKDGLLTGEQKGAIEACVARSN